MDGKAVRFITGCLAAFSLLEAAGEVASAQPFTTPQISVAHVDWRAARDQIRSELATADSLPRDFTFVRQHWVGSSDPRSVPALVQLNAATSRLFNGIGRSPVPVLLPFNTSAFLEARQSGVQSAIPLSRYQADFRPVDFFDAGPSGYDAMFALDPHFGDGPPRTFSKPIEVQITGSLLSYDVPDPAGGKGEPVRSLAAEYPDLRRFMRDGSVRYAFTRFGVPYVVSIACIDSVPRARRLACRETYPVLERFLKALHVAGGLPAGPARDMAPATVETPAEPSLDFTYRPVGNILLGSLYGSILHHQGGRTDLSVYSQIRFPLNAPSYLHSQSFGRHRTVDKSDSPGATYPWRDSFCEARSFNVGQCPSGFGHQGEDIRPGGCTPQDAAAGRCDLKRQPIFAVRDGIVLRSRQQQAATLQVNTATEHIRFRYMHLNPTVMDTDGVLNGRELMEGEQLGVVSNYLDHANGTSRHLHFDIQVFTHDGWIWVNPYATLISAYERLIGRHGTEIGPEMAASPVVHLPSDLQKRDMEEGSDR